MIYKYFVAIKETYAFTLFSATEIAAPYVAPDEIHFYGSKEVRGIKIISLPQLYVDLVSYGGRGEEAAQQILKLEKN